MMNHFWLTLLNIFSQIFPVTQSIIHSGKKKEAMIQCSLEACRILDTLGLLRQEAGEYVGTLPF